MAIVSAIGKRDRDLGLALLVQLHLAGGLRLPQSGHVRRIDGEIHIDRIDLLDIGQQGSAGAIVAGAVADERPDGDLLLSGDAVDRRNHIGVAEIEARAFDCGLVLLHLAQRPAFRRICVVHRLLRNDMIGVQQFPRALGGQFGVGQCRLILGEHGEVIVELGLVIGRDRSGTKPDPCARRHPRDRGA